MQVFISYKSQYRDFAKHLRDMLRAWGYQTWLDVDDIPEGAYFRHEIQKGLETSQIVIGVMTPEAFASREVMWEWDYALNNSHFVPLKYVECTLPYHLHGTQYIDFTHGETPALEKLRSALKSPPSPPPLRSKPAAIPYRDDNRARMLAKVRDSWIHGVLDPALHDTEFQLGMALKPDAVLKHVDYGDYTLPDTAGILEVFDDMGRELLILGAPGAGKTILMLQLAQKLLDRADANITNPIPVVFNLASWAEKQLPLEDWLIDNLTGSYGIPYSVGKRWIDNEQLLLMLDGLDEVRANTQNTCVEAINAFRQQHSNVDIVVCSRIYDYDRLTSKLNLQNAIVLQPLTLESIGQHLVSDEFAVLREAMKTDPYWYQQARIPFLFNTILFTYRGVSKGEIQRFDDPTKHLKRLFEDYVFKRFKLQPQNQYSLAYLKKTLTWIAVRMFERNQVNFHPFFITPDWLDAASLQFFLKAYELAYGLFYGLICGIILGLMLRPVAGYSGLICAVLFGVTCGLLMGFMGSFRKKNERFDLNGFTWTSFWIASSKSIFAGLPFSMLFWGISLLAGSTLHLELQSFFTLLVVAAYWGIAIGFLRQSNQHRVSVFFRPPLGLEDMVANSGGSTKNTGSSLLFVGAVTSIAYLLYDPYFIVPLFSTLYLIPQIHQIVNSGLLSIKPRILAAIILIYLYFSSMLSFALIFASIIGMIFAALGSVIHDDFGLLFGWVIGGSLGVAAAVSIFLTRLIEPLIRTYLIALLLIAKKNLPFNYTRFLDFCASIGILRKVGGGYIFQHRILLEYFAGLYDESKPS